MTQAQQYPQNFQHGLIELRLKTDNIMYELEVFLTGKKTRTGLNTKDELVTITENFGEPLANSEGVNAILKLISLQINPHVVQGNFDRPQYEEYLYWTRIELTNSIIANRPHWGIQPRMINTIIDGLMRFIEPYMSRLINNKERDSYNQYRSEEKIETTTNDRKSGGILGRYGGSS